MDRSQCLLPPLLHNCSIIQVRKFTHIFRMITPDMGKDEAFGIVPILQKDNQFHFLLIQHNAGHWGFPKGHADPGESSLQAACREFTEETGILDFTPLEDVSFSEEYIFTRSGKKFNKTVVYYPALVQSDQVHCQPEEIQDYSWLEYDRAISQLSFGGARQVLTQVQQFLADGHLTEPHSS